MTETHTSPTNSAEARAVPANERMTVKRREVSLISERLMMLLDVPYGAWYAARNFAIEAVHHFGEPALESMLDLVENRDSLPRWQPPTELETNVLEAHSVSALLVGNLIANYVLARTSPASATTFVVNNIADGAILDALNVRLRTHGLKVNTTLAGTAVTLDVEPAPVEARSTLFDQMAPGLSVKASTWWGLYHPSNLALSEETAVSRTHTGADITPESAVVAEFAAPARA